MNMEGLIVIALIVIVFLLNEIRRLLAAQKKLLEKQFPGDGGPPDMTKPGGDAGGGPDFGLEEVVLRVNDFTQKQAEEIKDLINSK